VVALGIHRRVFTADHRLADTVAPTPAERLGQRRPALGRLPWFALFRRARSRRFFDFFGTAGRVVVGRRTPPK